MAENDSEREHARELDAEAEDLLNRIESQTGSMYAVHAGDDAEELDPSKLHASDLAEDGIGSEELAHAVPLDEPPLEDDGAAQEDPLTAASADVESEPPVREHRGLKRALAITIVVLVLIVCVVGVLVWHNSISPAVDQADTEALATSQAGTDQVQFQKVASDEVPELSSVFGLKTRAAEKRLGEQFQPSGRARKAKDKRAKSMTQLLEGNWVDGSGKAVASIGLGLDKKGRVVYAYALYNLDTIQVASSSFAELVKSDVVAKSVLQGVGMPDAKLGVPKLEVEGSSKETATFRGAAGAKKAPKTWQLAETYAYGSDNATTRTLLVELY